MPPKGRDQPKEKKVAVDKVRIRILKKRITEF